MDKPIKMYQKNKGFTLIELLVVIAIISLLSSIVMTSLTSARAKARDAFRVASIRQVQTALELYNNDYGYYPQDDFSHPNPPANSDVSFCDATLTANLTPTYIASLPIDPVKQYAGECVYYNSHPSDYDSGNFHYYIGYTNPATWYAIYVPYETKTACYVCGGTLCRAGLGFWGVNMCQ